MARKSAAKVLIFESFLQSPKSSERLFVREMDERDFASWSLFMHDDQPKAKRDRAAFSKELKRERVQRKEGIRWEVKIFEKESKKMIGFIDIKTINREPYQICDVGYVILPEFQGRGYATEATRLVIPLIFKRLKFHRLEFAIAESNLASIRVAEALGLIDEGLRHNYWPTNYPKPSKVWADQLIYVTTPELWG